MSTTYGKQLRDTPALFVSPFHTKMAEKSRLTCKPPNNIFTAFPIKHMHFPLVARPQPAFPPFPSQRYTQFLRQMHTVTHGSLIILFYHTSRKRPQIMDLPSELKRTAGQTPLVKLRASPAEPKSGLGLCLFAVYHPHRLQNPQAKEHPCVLLPCIHKC